MHRRTLALHVLAALLPLAAPSAQTRPVTGTLVPQLAALDTAMLDFMSARGIDGGVLGVMRNGVVVLEHGYGWKDSARTTPLPPDAMLRIASVTKPITAAAIRKLVAAGRFSLSSFVFDLGQPQHGLLQLTPWPSLGDARLAQVTVQHLLDHEGGWDRDLVGDLTYEEIEIAQAMGVASPPGRTNTARYILGQPLQFAPGARSAYSNIGYMMLGLVVEQYAAMPYLDYVRSAVFGGVPVSVQDLELGRSLAANQNPREPKYFTSSSCWSVFAPSSLVNCAYGGWHHEARVGQGNIISATEPLLHFLQRYYISGPSIGAPRSGTEGATWRRNHTGALSGTSSVARQRGDGINFVVIFNERESSGSAWSDLIRDTLDGVIDQITVWPTTTPASVAWVGAGCGHGIPHALNATPPVLGQTQVYSMTGDYTGATAASLLLAVTRPTPIPLGGGCVLQIGGGSHVALPLVTTGLATLRGVNLPVPSTTALIGTALTGQGATLVPGGPLLGVAALSNGLEMVVGL